MGTPAEKKEKLETETAIAMLNMAKAIIISSIVKARRPESIMFFECIFIAISTGFYL